MTQTKSKRAIRTHRLSVKPMVIFPPPSYSHSHVKRLLDLMLVVVSLPAVIPVVIILAILVKLSSPVPIFFRQLRIGKNGMPFFVYKFRTMVMDAEERLDKVLKENPGLYAEWKGQGKLSRDPRVTRLGCFLRSTSLDELPQLWNVACGEMSIVGPRPLPDYHLNMFAVDFVQRRQTMMPGLTGMWQVSCRSDGGNASFERWDDYYYLYGSLGLDSIIIARTVYRVLMQKGAC